MELKKAYDGWWTPPNQHWWQNCLADDSRSKMQNMIMIWITPTKNAKDWTTLLQAKGAHLGIAGTTRYWSRILRLLQSSCRGYCATSYFKTILNSWTTSWRYHHEDGFSCILGCGCPDASDSVPHYLFCSCARDALALAFRFETSSDMAVFGNEITVGSRHVHIVAVLFIAYHTFEIGQPGPGLGRRPFWTLQQRATGLC